ncbi:hypothetical protein B0H34DRAFT_128722 [Crassisporium funariophilum]|nr:hypothetical protein B0H34DRAFT_128722 [Crassisporium funariophilum]
MSSLNPFLFLVASAVEGGTGEGTSSSPRPVHSQIFHINPFAHLNTIASTSTYSSRSTGSYNSPAPSSNNHLHNTDNFPYISHHHAIMPSIYISSSCNDTSSAPDPHSNTQNHTIPSKPAPCTNHITFTPASRIIKPRKPRAGCEIIESSFRPHVAARDRLFHLGHSIRYTTQITSRHHHPKITRRPCPHEYTKCPRARNEIFVCRGPSPMDAILRQIRHSRK